MAPARQKMPQKVKQRLQQQKRPKILVLVWLNFMLNLGFYPGLRWVDRTKGTFRVYCTHQRAKHWSQELAAHGEGWSEIKNNSGKKHKTHKACFRTTLNSKGKNNQIRKIRKIKGEDGDWIEYCFIDKSFLLNEPDSFLQSYYLESQRGFSSSKASPSKELEQLQGEPSTKNSLPSFDSEFKNDLWNEPKLQNFGRQEPTTIRKEVQSPVHKTIKPVNNRKSNAKRTKNLNQKPRSRKNGSSATTQNSPVSGNALHIENCFADGDEAMLSPQYYLNQMTPEPQTTDVYFKESDYQNLHCLKNQENYSTNSEYQPYTPMSSVGDIQEAFSPNSLHHVPYNSFNSLNCIYNPNETSFYPSSPNTSIPNTGDQTENIQVYYQLQPPFYSNAPSHQSSQTIQDVNLLKKATPELNFEHLPECQNEESMFKEVFLLLEKYDILSHLEIDNCF